MKSRLSVLVVLTIVSGLQPAAAREVSKPYDLSGASAMSVEDPTGVSGDGSFEVGGVTFEPLGGRGVATIEVAVDDAVGETNRIHVCEDLDADGVCSSVDGDRVSESRCIKGPSDLWGTWVEFEVRRDVPITVVVEPYYPCITVLHLVREWAFGTRGVVTLRW